MQYNRWVMITGVIVFLKVFLSSLFLNYSLQVGHGLHPSNESVILHWVVGNGQFPGQV